MEAPMELRKPGNWQDFETLCMRLWGEIWECPEIKKNGRLGQSQNGVDVSGKPKGQTSYFGIQCKCKSGGKEKLAAAEIDREIEQATKFQPALAKLYIATTADKDAVTEEYVRLRNEEQIKKGHFEVHLYCWQDIAGLIEQSPGTFNFYVNSINFRTSQRMEIEVNGEAELLDTTVEFLQQDTYYLVYEKSRQRINDKLISSAQKKMMESVLAHKKLAGTFSSYDVKKTVNKSLMPLLLTIRNSGIVALEHFKISIRFTGNHLAVLKSNVVSDNSLMHIFENIIAPGAGGIPNIRIEDDTVTVLFGNRVLVGSDDCKIGPIYLKVDPIEDTNVQLQWEMLSKSYRATGDFTIKIKPVIKKRRTEIIVDTVEEEKIIAGNLEDLIEEDKPD